MPHRTGTTSLRSLKVLVPFLLVCLAETTLFNLPFWESLFFPATQTVSVTTGTGISVQDGRYTIIGTADAVLRLQLPESSGMTIRNVLLDMAQPSESGHFTAGHTFTVIPSIKDEGHSTSAANTNAAHVSEGLVSTHYIRLHTAGKVKSLSLSFSDDEGASFALSSVRINARPPFHWTWSRFLCVLAAVYLVYVFWPTRSMYQWRLNLRENRQKTVLAVFLVVQALVLVLTTQLILPSHVFASTYLTAHGAFINDDNQYNHLADAILAGHAYLDLPVPDWLTTMTNPYDPPSRAAMTAKTGEPTYWDYAFFDGKYYSYFGVLPALLTFVPFKLMTRHDLRTDAAVALFAVAFLLASAFFLRRIFARYARNVSFGVYLASCLGFVTGCGVLVQTFLPKIYSLPILSALTFTLCGLALWLGARKRHGRMSKSSLMLGAFCIALTLGCRPQFVLTALFAFPIFAQEICERLFFSRRGLTNTLCAVLPFLLCGAAAMAYNHVRFGSFFDFGAQYNLTGFDMVRSERSLARLPWALWLYLFQPLNVTAVYPFLKQVDSASMYHGFLIMEPTYGGLFAFAPMALFVVCIPRFHCQLRRLLPLAALMAGYAFVVLTVDMRIGGVSSRYLSDFSWTILAVACVVVAVVLQEYEPGLEPNVAASSMRTVILYTFVILVLAGVAVSYWNLLSDGKFGELRTYNNTLYRLVESWFLPLA
ncbi:hypothetical protein KIH79_12265 [Bifidobacterium sp. 82T10]|uniref:Glycosyltransferase n=1 Tax=Bifidobacterium miconis TaxID=2834435 RepID=A0ABS6WHZ0_9BIFI|nr:hypothetical protein [Bifidobacterium miconis]MBW3093675.1 hypothetical protein [Bifidobacterium miconis]